MTSPRILFVSTVGEVGGGESCMLRIVDGLVERRYDVSLACPPTSVLAVRARQSGVAVVPLDGPAGFDEDAVYDLSPTVQFREKTTSWKRRLRVGRNYARVLPAALALSRSVRRGGFAMVHANSPRAATIGGLAARLSGRPVVTHVRDIVHTPFARRLGRPALALLSDAFIAASHATKAAITVDRPVDVVYDGLTPGVLQQSGTPLAELPDSPLIAMVAHLVPWKGQDQFIRAAAHVLQRSPRARFVCYGGDSGHTQLIAYRQHLERLIDELGVRGRVTLAGSRPDVLQELARADLFVHPPTAADPFPGAVLEACAMSRPIVATRSGGIPEIIMDDVSGRLITPGEPKLLADAIVELLTHRDRAARFGREARRSVERFTLAATIDGVEAVYDRLLHAAPSSDQGALATT